MEIMHERALMLGRYIAETGDTVRGAAARYGLAKSTVHSDVARRLRRIDPSLFLAVDAVLQRNKLERHIRGGQATRQKYLSASRSRP